MAVKFFTCFHEDLNGFILRFVAGRDRGFCPRQEDLTIVLKTYYDGYFRRILLVYKF
jgi:hypothetical protein